MLSNFEHNFIGFGHFCNRSEWHFNGDIFAGSPGAERFPSGLAMSGLEMPCEFKVQQGPELLVAFEYDMASPSAIAAVRASFRNILSPVKVCRSGSTFARSAMYLDVIDEVWGRHCLNLVISQS
jgi:hypothetical protein